MMRLFARVVWTNKERTLGKVILLWRCPEHQMATRWYDGDPPPCPICVKAVKIRKA